MKLWLAVAALMTGTIAAHAADPQEAWERAVKAKGGRERLHSVHSLAIYLKPAQVMMGGPPTTWLCVFPDRYFEFQGTGYGGGQRAIVVDGTADRVAMDATGQPRATRHMGRMEHDRLTLNQIVFLLESAWLQPQPVAARRNEVTVQAGGREFQISLDRADLPERVVALPMPGEPKHLYDYRLQHYREFQGVWLPARVTSTSGMREWIWDADYDVDPKYNPKMFERMPDLADGPEPWRRR
jgi:hypothetical protein